MQKDVQKVVQKQFERCWMQAFLQRQSLRRWELPWKNAKHVGRLFDASRPIFKPLSGQLCHTSHTIYSNPLNGGKPGPLSGTPRRIGHLTAIPPLNGSAETPLTPRHHSPWGCAGVAQTRKGSLHHLQHKRSLSDHKKDMIRKAIINNKSFSLLTSQLTTHLFYLHKTPLPLI